MPPKPLPSPAFPLEASINLQRVKISGVEIHICPVSGGLWFERFEIQKFDEGHDNLTNLLQLIPKKPTYPEILKDRRSPRHPRVIMEQQAYGPRGTEGVLTIDRCPVSAGLWLDLYEIQKIRELYPSDDYRQRAVTSFANQAFKDFPKSPMNSTEPSFLFALLMRLVD